MKRITHAFFLISFSLTENATVFTSPCLLTLLHSFIVALKMPNPSQWPSRMKNLDGPPYHCNCLHQKQSPPPPLVHYLCLHFYHQFKIHEHLTVYVMGANQLYLSHIKQIGKAILGNDLLNFPFFE